MAVLVKRNVLRKISIFFPLPDFVWPLFCLVSIKNCMKRETTNPGIPSTQPPEKQLLDKKAEKYLREGGKIEDMPEGKKKDKDPQRLAKLLKKEQSKKHN